MKRTIAIAAAAALAAASVVVNPAVASAQHRSWGYHASPGGSPATPAAPPRDTDTDGDGILDDSVQQIDYSIPQGRANIHSGGRLHGSANKRVGCGGCGSHPAEWDFVHPGVTVPLMTDGFGRNRGTRPHHPRATCRCN